MKTKKKTYDNINNCHNFNGLRPSDNLHKQQTNNKLMKTLEIKIYQEKFPDSPREWDNIGNMICFHNRYNLGDPHNFTEPSELHELLKEEPEIVYLPLFLYDHSGITMSTATFSCPWDSGQVGYIYATPEDAKKIGAEWDPEKIKTYLKAEVETYDQYLRGDVWCYLIEDNDNNVLDSCGGFFGYEYAKKEAFDMAKYYKDTAIKNHLKKLKNWIKNRAPMYARENFEPVNQTLTENY